MVDKLAAGESTTATVLLDSAGLAPGFHSATVHVESNCGFTPDVSIPVSFRVLPAKLELAGMRIVDGGTRLLVEWLPTGRTVSLEYTPRLRGASWQTIAGPFLPGTLIDCVIDMPEEPQGYFRLRAP